MRNWDALEEEEGEGRWQCSQEEDYEQVQAVCSKIGIPCRRLDFVKEYWNNVFR